MMHIALRERLRIIGNFRRILARDSSSLLAEMGHLQRTPTEVLASEVIPLADACLFLERKAAGILRMRKLGRKGRPLWVGRTVVRVYREALGRVLVIGPANYPLFLPGVQIVQGLAAGNVMVVKPGRGGEGVMRIFAGMLEEAGLPRGMFRVTSEDVGEVQRAVEAGVAKVFLTGGAEAGRTVMRMLAERCVPAVMELSGCDAVVVLGSADVGRAAKAIAYGRRLNGGETCIAPRRVFVAEGVRDDFVREIQGLEVRWLAPPEAAGVGGGICGVGGTIVGFGSGEDVAALVNDCPWKLGATIFGEEEGARKLAEQLDVGMAVINDMIVPTADPRVAFGGRGLSGFGVTRGAEGLLEMTAVKTVIVRRGKFLPHLDKPSGGDREMFEAYLRAAHGVGIGERVRAGLRFLKLALRRGKSGQGTTGITTETQRHGEDI